MWFAIPLTILMGGTGILMEGEINNSKKWLTSKFDLVSARQLHGSTSQWLLIALSVMILTGLVMWGYPLLVKKTSHQNNE